MDRLEKAKAFYNLSKISYETALHDMTRTQVLSVEPFVDEWAPGKYEIGDIRRHNNQVWEVAQAHDNTNNPDIEPGLSPAHWFAYHSKSIEYAKAYVEAEGAHDAYQEDEYMIWTDGRVYKSTINANTWTPDTYSEGWAAVEE